MVTLVAEEARHAARVLRQKKGDDIVVSDGLGKRYEAKIVSISFKEVVAKIQSVETGKNEPQIRLALAVGLTKGEKFDWLVEKATEMGVTAIFPFFARHSEIRWNAEQIARNAARWQRVALAAFKQCGRSVLPKIEVLKNLAEVISRKKDAGIVAAHPVTESATSLERPRPLQDVMGVVGPEGGFAPEELEAIRQSGGQLVSLGPRRLRTETAGLVLMAKLFFLKAEL